ncbi:ATP-binding protein [Spirillospora sp. CA-255316]
MPPSSPSPRFTHDPDGTGRECERLVLPALPGAAGAARRFTAARLRKWGLDALVEDCELVASELVTNAVQAVAYGSVPAAGAAGAGEPPPDVRLLLRLTPGRLLCEVWDPVDARPVPAAAATFDECGRGLLLVASLAGGWTCRPCPDGGKTVVAWWELGTGLPE